MPISSQLHSLMNVATRLRIDSVRATSEAGSGHPSTCCSAADIMAVLFFAEMAYDPQNAEDPDNDRFVLSKGHAAPILYAAWAEAGIIRRDELLTLRQLDSDLEGHPTPRLPWVDVATGSLGQGLAAGVGIALNARRINSPHRTYVLLGDGELAEGSVWEAAQMAAYYGLGSLCGITDVNALGQTRRTMWQHDMEALAARWRSVGWHTVVVDGHDITAVREALEDARQRADGPTMVLARTIKGKGLSALEDQHGWHGKALKKGAELDQALAELESHLVPDAPAAPRPRPPQRVARPARTPTAPPAPPWRTGEQVATREAFGAALARLGAADDRVVALDADVKNSTFTEIFEQQHPDRFYQSFIAEQAMLGTAMGLAARGAIPFAATFAAFLSRAYDFIRMAAISHLNVKMAGSHAGVSIGEDGPSQMALEDLAIMRAQPNIVVLYPCDAVSTERLVATAAAHDGPVYIRTSRPKTPVIYGPTEEFPIGGLKVLRKSGQDAALVVTAGVTVFEALAACEQLEGEGVHVRLIDLYSVQPLDAAALAAAAGACHGRVVTVEDHYLAGGIGEAVSSALTGQGARIERLAVREIPRSGTPEALMDRYGLSAPHIAAAVRRVVAG